MCYKNIRGLVFHFKPISKNLAIIPDLNSFLELALFRNVGVYFGSVP